MTIDPVDIAERRRDRDEQAATSKHEQWLQSEEYRNAVQLKFEAMLADPEWLDEALRYEGIQYPRSCAGPARGFEKYEDLRKRQIDYEENIYYPRIGSLVLEARRFKAFPSVADIYWRELGKIIANQVHDYLHKIAEGKIKDSW